MVALVIGASRGLGLELTKLLHSRGNHVFATVRSLPKSGTFPDGVNVIHDVDVANKNAGELITQGLKGEKVDLTIINAGYFTTEVCDHFYTHRSCH